MPNGQPKRRLHCTGAAFFIRAFLLAHFIYRYFALIFFREAKYFFGETRGHQDRLISGLMCAG